MGKPGAIEVTRQDDIRKEHQNFCRVLLEEGDGGVGRREARHRKTELFHEHGRVLSRKDLVLDDDDTPSAEAPLANHRGRVAFQGKIANPRAGRPLRTGNRSPDVAGYGIGIHGQSRVTDVLNAFLLVYVGLFPIINPIGGAPIFLGLTRHSSDHERHLLARKVAVNGFFLLLGSLFAGSHVLQFFGITLPVVRIAGGLVVTAFAWKLLHSGEEIDDTSAAHEVHGSISSADSFYPLTMPLTVGPGSISVAITLGSQRPAEAMGLGRLALLGGAAIAGLLATAATVYICYRYAENVVAVLGAGGTNVLVRLSAFILLCIGIQIVWAGYTSLEALPQ
jgi:multiple antibiotic resistance protein